MAETTMELIARIQAMPKTRIVVATWADGTEHAHKTHSEGAANNYAQHMRFRGAVSATVSKIEG